MLRLNSTISAVTRKTIILVISFLCLTIAAILGLLSSYKVDVLRADVANANAARDVAEHRRITQETELKTREMAVAGEEAKIAEAENKAAKLGAELAQLQKDKTELQAKLEETPAAASTPEQQPTPAPPSLEIKAEHVEGTTPPPERSTRQKMAPVKAPQVADRPPTTSISSAKALAIYAPHPDYPHEARSRGISGSGVCVVSIDPGSGSVTAASMAQSTGDSRLDKAALDAFRQWRFKPGTVSIIRIPIEFKP